jgi:hypothetical protein
MSDTAQNPSPVPQTPTSTYDTGLNIAFTGAQTGNVPAEPQVQPQPMSQPIMNDAVPPNTAAVVSDQVMTGALSPQLAQQVPDPTTAIAQAVPQVIDQVTDTLNPQHAVGGTVKESRDANIILEKPAVDQIPGVQYVEQERNAEVELPPEVDGFLKEVENHHDQVPQEIVIADQQGMHPTTQYLAKPVVVLPITPEVEKKGQGKNTQFSVRWLVEWCHKVMKAFSGKVIYREA